MGAVEVWKERREERERVQTEMEEKRRLKFLRYATVILSWILLDEVERRRFGRIILLAHSCPPLSRQFFFKETRQVLNCVF